ncbi:MAG: DUF805 domain-containing protein [Bacteroidetes bacterium]|nr:DUF805 domain-containing protein [Bacteroidota bacterium]
MVDWWKKVVFKNYANFEGRARRSEYWYYTLLNIIIVVPLAFLIGFVGGGAGEDSPIFYIGLGLLLLIALALLIPSIAVAVRRLHDTNKSGWWYLLGVIPLVSYIGGIVLLVFYCSNGDSGTNQYGQDPKISSNSDEISQIGTE